MSAGREEAIQDFIEATDIDRRLLEVIAKVLAKSPRAVLVVWETDDAFGMTAVPFSRALVKGMVDTAFDMVFGDIDVSEEASHD